MNVDQAGVQPSRSMLLLDQSGDTRIGWDPAHDAEMRALIARKIDEGVRFFIIPTPKVRHWFVNKKKRPIEDVHEVVTNEVFVHDQDFQAIFRNGGLHVSKQKTEGPMLETYKMSKDPEEIAQSHSAALRPLRGG